MLLRRRGCPARGDRNPWSAAVGVRSAARCCAYRYHSVWLSVAVPGPNRRLRETVECDGCEQESSGRCERSLAGQGHHSPVLASVLKAASPAFKLEDLKLVSRCCGLHSPRADRDSHHRSPAPSCAAQNRSRGARHTTSQPPGFLPAQLKRRRRSESRAKDLEPCAASRSSLRPPR